MNYRHLSVPLNLLRANPWNTNVVSPANEAKIDESIKRLGLFKPIIVRSVVENEEEMVYEVLGGEHRWRSATRLGLASVPIVDLGEVSDQSAKEISLIDNGRYGVDDAVGLAKLMQELGTPDELSVFMPFTDADMNALFKSVASVNLDDLSLDDERTPETDPSAGTTSGPTHQILRFKVPVDDAGWVSEMVEKAMKQQGFTKADSLTNAGDALVHLLRRD